MTAPYVRRGGSTHRAMMLTGCGLLAGAVGLALDAALPGVLANHGPAFWGMVGSATGVLVSLTAPLHALLGARERR